MNYELIGVINDDFNYLAHYGLPGMKWYVNKAERYQNHAKYARGNPRYARGNSKSNEDINAPAPKYNFDKLLTSVGLPVASSGAFALTTAAVAIGVGNPIVGVSLAIGSAASAIGSVPSLSKTIKAYRDEIKNEKRMSKLEVDEETGLHLKDKNFPPSADLSKINPGFNNLRNDTKNNCMLCSVAYDMRKRGYDVAANKSLIGYTDRDLKRWYPDAKHGKIINKDNIGKRKNFVDEATKNIVDQGEGARGIATIGWANGWGCHAVAYRVRNGHVILLDGQTNKEYYSWSDGYKNLIKSAYSVTPTRLDNVSFDKNTIKEAVH